MFVPRREVESLRCRAPGRLDPPRRRPTTRRPIPFHSQTRFAAPPRPETTSSDPGPIVVDMTTLELTTADERAASTVDRRSPVRSRRDYVPRDLGRTAARTPTPRPARRAELSSDLAAGIDRSGTACFRRPERAIWRDGRTPRRLDNGPSAGSRYGRCRDASERHRSETRRPDGL